MHNRFSEELILSTPIYLKFKSSEGYTPVFSKIDLTSQQDRKVLLDLYSEEKSAAADSFKTS